MAIVKEGERRERPCKGKRKKVRRNDKERFDVRRSKFEVEEKRKGKQMKKIVGKTLKKTFIRDAKKRCPWCLSDPLYIEYHDREWGVPVHDDRTWFEFLVLEGAQAGLNWLLVLKKRENYRRAYDGFDFNKVAGYDEKKIARLLADPGLIRNRAKIAASMSNARAFIRIREEFSSFDRYIWPFVNEKPLRNRWKTDRQIPARTALSDTLSADLRKRGFKFVGSTIVYAHMQATGMVNDHLIDCFRYKELASGKSD